ncbi:MAG: recombinase family protein [Candidatus Solibacter sp.]|nr:recombinase family protein [Candidatus Solibacter sp.]
MPELKVTSAHLERDAYLCVRQSTPRQVVEKVESTQRQYALRDRAVAQGSPLDRIHVIDCDLGKSAAHYQSTDRDGFQQLVGEVALGKAGIVMGLEVSRLARNSADWRRLIELCAIAGTLILDEDGLYDPAAYNERLLLGLKGELSQAELHFLKVRMPAVCSTKRAVANWRWDHLLAWSSQLQILPLVDGRDCRRLALVVDFVLPLRLLLPNVEVLLPRLRTTLASTNLIESTFSMVETVCRNVKHWQGGDQYLRWVGSGLLLAETRWNRVHGYREIPVLVKELELAVLKEIPLRHAVVA